MSETLWVELTEFSFVVTTGPCLEPFSFLKKHKD